jgi:polyisoprenoid-binding protein YceI
MSGSTVRTALAAAAAATAGAHATTAVINKRHSTIILTYDSFVCVSAREIACTRLVGKLLGWLNFRGQFGVG